VRPRPLGYIDGMSDVWLWPEPYGRPSDDLTGGEGPSAASGPAGPGGGALDVVGFDVEAIDGGIGTIDEASYDVGAGRFVVDTGFWIFGKKRVIPAGLVTGVEPDERKVFIRCTRQAVKDAPDYDPEVWDEEHRQRVGQHFGRT
jgi:hypothetical protein